MATLELPARTDLTFYDFTVDLDGATFTFVLRWNVRDAAWYLSVSDAAGSPIADGRRVVLGAPILGRGVDPRMPLGELFAFDTSGDDREAGIPDLGGRVRLLYVEAIG